MMTSFFRDPQPFLQRGTEKGSPCTSLLRAVLRAPTITHLRCPDQSAVGLDYPNSPHPKDAVHRIENTTNPIIHISSFFMGIASFRVDGFRLP
jgi:hypothetical protein